MAKMIFPLIEEYIEKEKTINEKFIKDYIKLYSNKWLRESKNLMTYHSIIASETDYVSILQSKFRYGNVYDSSTPITVNALELWKQSDLTKVLIITKDNKQIIDQLKAVFPEVKTDFNEGKDFIFNQLLNDKTQLIIFNVVDKSFENLANSFTQIIDLGVVPKIRYK